ncbi:MAG: DUF5926 family protein [Actinomycetaceae bacterium]|nr:DUF5926 family protein [Arcanobacterium sp.]MDD7686944.1 DUF5926 family protein [Actinomycetaceae bacterium]MDY5273517.1 DUF5926 family protein [Arcanobacterium sp.]
MGKASRRKNKEMKAKTKRSQVPYVDRPFEGLPFEVQLVAMREILPSATLPVRTTSEYGERELLLVTMLPEMVGALRRSDGVLMVAVRTVLNSGDASLDIADRLIHALELEDGQTFTQVDLPEAGGPRLENVLDVQATGELDVRTDLAFWIGEKERENPEIAAAIDAAREQIIPMAQVPGVPGAFWARMQREFVRWVRPEGEDQVLAALARLQNRRELSFDGARFVGAFRASGLLIPVFELERGTEADDLTEPMQAFAQVLEREIASDAPLTFEERQAKAGIVSRQVTLR